MPASTSARDDPTAPCTTLLKNRIKLTNKYCEIVSGMENGAMRAAILANRRRSAHVNCSFPQDSRPCRHHQSG
jgi:hypothetical protein